MDTLHITHNFLILYTVAAGGHYHPATKTNKHLHLNFYMSIPKLYSTLLNSFLLFLVLKYIHIDLYTS